VQVLCVTCESVMLFPFLPVLLCSFQLRDVLFNLPVPVLLINSPCFNNPVKQCNYTFSQNTANCGNPQTVPGNTICTVCTRV